MSDRGPQSISGNVTEQVQLGAPAERKPAANAPKAKFERGQGFDRVVISTDGSDPNTRQPETARPSAQPESNKKYIFDAYSNTLRVEDTSKKPASTGMDTPNTVRTVAGTVVTNLGTLRELDEVLIGGKSTSVIEHLILGNLVRGEDGQLRLPSRGAQSVVNNTTANTTANTSTQQDATDEPMALSPSMEADLKNIGRVIGAGATLGLVEAMARGTDVTSQVEALASNFGVEPAQMQAKVDAYIQTLSLQAILATRSNPEEYQSFSQWADRERPEQARAARADAVEYGKYGKTKALMTDFRQNSPAAAFSDGELLGLNGALVNGQSITVWKDATGRVMFNSPATGAIDMRAAVRSGVIRISPSK